METIRENTEDKERGSKTRNREGNGARSERGVCTCSEEVEGSGWKEANNKIGGAEQEARKGRNRMAEEK